MSKDREPHYSQRIKNQTATDAVQDLWKTFVKIRIRVRMGLSTESRPDTEYSVRMLSGYQISTLLTPSNTCTNQQVTDVQQLSIPPLA